MQCSAFLEDAREPQQSVRHVGVRQCMSSASYSAFHGCTCMLRAELHRICVSVVGSFALELAIPDSRMLQADPGNISQIWGRRAGKCSSESRTWLFLTALDALISCLCLSARVHAIGVTRRLRFKRYLMSLASNSPRELEGLGGWSTEGLKASVEAMTDTPWR